MKITTDFECGAGKRLSQLDENHWRIEANGDGSGYDKHFCVRITNEDDAPPALLRLEVHPDEDLGEDGARFFSQHFPSSIWHHTGNWRQWKPLRSVWEDSVTFHEGWFELRVPVEPGADLHIATNPVRRYSDMLEWVETTREKHGDRVEVGSIGQSVDGRDIPVLRVPGPRDDPPKLFVFAAQHPSEHGGNWASEGIVEYALSHISDAREITDNFDLAVVPMVNPDGNVRGLSGSNAVGVNMFEDFAGAADGDVPEAKEDRLLWQWLCSEFPPDVILHFHGYMGRRNHCGHPYDGVYVLVEAEKLYADPDRLTAYRAIQDRLVFETPAFTSNWRPGQLTDVTIEHQLAAKFGTLSAFYEINTSSVTAFEQFRRGPQVLSAVVRALVRDAGLSPFNVGRGARSQ